MSEDKSKDKKINKKKLALIHIVKKELQLSEIQYRKLLQNIAGVKSAKELDEEQFRKLMKFLVRSEHYLLNELGLTIKQKLYVDYLIKQLGWNRERLLNFIQKYYHKPDLIQLSKTEAIKLIESLKNIKQHLKADHLQ